jgi:hypothetical protein
MEVQMLAVIVAAVFFGVATQSTTDGQYNYVPKHDSAETFKIPANTAGRE